jgi:hypothetical protein
LPSPEPLGGAAADVVGAGEAVEPAASEAAAGVFDASGAGSGASVPPGTVLSDME